MITEARSVGAKLPATAGLPSARERKQLVDETYAPLGDRREHTQSPPPFLGIVLPQRLLHLHSKPGQRCAQLMGGVRNEGLLSAQHRCKLFQQPVDGGNQRLRFHRRVGFRHAS